MKLKSLLFAISVLLAGTLMSACSSIDCPVKNKVYSRYSLMKATGIADTLRDTLSVYSCKLDRKDTTIYNSGIGQTAFDLPVSYTCPEDTLYFWMRGADGFRSLDTVWIKKENIPHFESVDCSAAFFHHIEAVRSTHHGLDSIVVKNPDINYETTTPPHFYVYIKDRR